MSYRATYTTEFLYEFGNDKELVRIEKVLKKYCRTVVWQGRNGMGYFHGIIKGLYDGETQKDEKVIIPDLKAKGIRIKIVHEE